eukprot:scaffold354_cov234-Pinguiococcus_pyrenoidosus.AAC.2
MLPPHGYPNHEPVDGMEIMADKKMQASVVGERAKAYAKLQDAHARVLDVLQQLAKRRQPVKGPDAQSLERIAALRDEWDQQETREAGMAAVTSWVGNASSTASGRGSAETQAAGRGATAKAGDGRAARDAAVHSHGTSEGAGGSGAAGQARRRSGNPSPNVQLRSARAEEASRGATKCFSSGQRERIDSAGK